MSIQTESENQAELELVLRRVPELDAILRELFLGNTEVLIESDPEIPDCVYVVFQVTLPARPANLRNLRMEWYDRIVNLLGSHCDKIRLSLRFQPQVDFPTSEPPTDQPRAENSNTQ